jgi:hypothetical protein
VGRIDEFRRRIMGKAYGLSNETIYNIVEDLCENVAPRISELEIEIVSGKIAVEIRDYDINSDRRGSDRALEIVAGFLATAQR